MKYEILDTPPHIQKLLIAGYRNMTPQQKFQRVSELNKAVQQFVCFSTYPKAVWRDFRTGAKASFSCPLAESRDDDSRL
jgi:hypothetical protein